MLKIAGARYGEKGHKKARWWAGFCGFYIRDL
jgi:hypothetical protein